jgi:2'-5' RNA ligase
MSGIREESGILKALAEELDSLLLGVGIEPENRPYSPHLTLGRVKEQGSRDIFSSVLTMYKNAQAGEVRVDRISLMRSDLRPQGPIYSTLHVAELQEVAT